MLNRTHCPRPFRGVGRGNGLRARVFWGPVHPITNSTCRLFGGGTSGPHLSSPSFVPSGLGPGVSVFLKPEDRGGTCLVRRIHIDF